MRLIITAEPIIPSWQVELINNCYLICNSQPLTIITVNGFDETNSTRKDAGLSVKKLSTHLLDRRTIDPDAFSLFNLYQHFKNHKAIHLIDKSTVTLPESDILINLVSLLDEKKLAQATGRPVLGIRFGDSADINNPLVTACHVLSCSPSTSLQVLEATPDQDSPDVIYEAASSTKTSSTRANASQLAWKTAECIPRILSKNNQSSRSWPSAPSQAKVNIIRECAMQPAAKNISGSNTSLTLLAKWFFFRAANKIKKKFIRKQWVLALGKQSSPLTMPEKLTMILPPQDRFWADPHLIEHRGENFVFFEELLYQTNRGRICCSHVDKRGLLGDTIPVLERDYHLSYPFLLEKNGEIFMIPESADNGTIELYKCRRFPDQWDYQGDLMQGVIAYDTTLLHHNGYWWLFANMSPIKGISSWDQLHLYYAREFPTDNWTPHPANPVIDDVRYSRPAGRIFIENGRLYRPSQDSAGRYGRALNMQEIIELSPEKYSETPYWKWLPHHFSRHVCAVHSFSHRRGWIALDLQVNTYPWSHKKMMHLQPKFPLQGLKELKISS